MKALILLCFLLFVYERKISTGSTPKCLVSEHLMEAGTGRFEYKSDLVRKRIEQELNMKKVFASLSKKQKKLLVTSHKKWLLP